MKPNYSLPESLSGENYAIIAQGDHAHIYPGELHRIQTLDEMKALQTPGKVVTFLTPSSTMREAGREAIGDEPILAIVSDTKKIQYMTRERLQSILLQQGNNDFHIGASTASMTDEDYVAQVYEAQEHIRNGDICQVVLARNFTSPITGMDPDKTPLGLLGRLLQIRGTYMTALFRTKDDSYLYASPERHLTIRNGHATINPIAGTMKIGEPETFEKRLEDFALRDEKEAKELTMLLDEGTKMIAEFCPHGEIEGPSLRETGAVIHTEYRISGKVVTGTHVIDALRKTLNAPTLTGSPIDRACEIIARMEQITRGYYGGVFGVYRNHGNLDSAIAIRGITLNHQNATITQSAGAGITLNSDPESEAEETINKAAGVRRVITSAVTDATYLSRSQKSTLERRMRLARNVHLNSFLMRKQDKLEPCPELLGKKIQIINFDDNFAHILGVMIQSLGADVTVTHYSKYTPGEEILVFGGGPGDINDARDPKMNRLREILSQRGNTPLLGICLGCQAICQHLGFDVRKLPVPRQGIQKKISLGKKEELVGFYNSFAGFGQKKGVSIKRNPDKSINFIHDQEEKMLGIQFHPESVMTENGRELLKGFLLQLIGNNAKKCSPRTIRPLYDHD